MEKIQKFLAKVDWKRMGKIAIVIVPVLIWEVWYNTIKFVATINEKISNAGDKFLTEFMEK